MIGPKTWDRIDRIFERENGAAVTAPWMLGGCLVVMGVNLCIKCLFGMLWAGNGRGLQVH